MDRHPAGGRGIVTRQPIRAAYEAGGAIRRHCELCDAGPDQWCIDPRGRIRRVPCVTRTRPQDRVSDATPTAVDFSEPRHRE